MPTTMPRRHEDQRVAGAAPAARRSCGLCDERIEKVDFKDAVTLRRFVSEKGRIRSRHVTGACRRHQIQIAAAVKRAREMALLPHVNS
jgi:small subunit ribosomal protein S18